MNRHNRLICWTCVIVWGVAVISLPVGAYDRHAARDYAIYWGQVDEDPVTGYKTERYNTSVYREFASDCTNFASQCLIAGGIRFRSKWWGTLGINDNTFDGIGMGLEERETGVLTGYIVSSNEKAYSRTINTANLLPGSITHDRHAYDKQKRKYTKASELQDNSTPFWNDVDAGDLAFVYSGTSRRFGHAYVISTPVKDSSPKDIKVSAHTSHKSDYSLNGHPDFGIGTSTCWKDGYLAFVCLPDAPRLIDQSFWCGWGTNAKPLSFIWGIKRITPDGNSIRTAGPSDLVIKLTFDTDMNTDVAPDIHIRVNGQNYTAAPLTGDGLNSYGWWTDASTSGFVMNMTWKGVIYGSQTQGVPQANKLPSGVNGIGRLWIHAQAKDGSWNDSDNGLSKYDPDTGMRLIAFNIDTRKSAVKKPQ